jgi:hypothetical protein
MQTTNTTAQDPAVNVTTPAINNTTISAGTTPDVHNTTSKGRLSNLFPGIFKPSRPKYPKYPKYPTYTYYTPYTRPGYHFRTHSSGATQLDVVAKMGVACVVAVGVAVVVGMAAL